MYSNPLIHIDVSICTHKLSEHPDGKGGLQSTPDCISICIHMCIYVYTLSHTHKLSGHPNGMGGLPSTP